MRAAYLLDGYVKPPEQSDGDDDDDEIEIVGTIVSPARHAHTAQITVDELPDSEGEIEEIIIS